MTQPQPALAASVSESTPMQIPDPQAPLICEADAIFDRAAVAARIQAAAEQGDEDRALRGEVVKILMEAQKSGRAAIEAAFLEQPFAARPMTRAYTWLTDCLVDQQVSKGLRES